MATYISKLLKIAEPGNDRFAGVRMALKLNGKDDRLRRADFKALAATAGIKAGDAELAIDAFTDAVATAAEQLAFCRRSLPTVPAADVVGAIRRLVAERIENFG